MSHIVTPFEHEVEVRYGEADQMGVVYHANYLLYFEEGRTKMMAALGLPYAEVERRGCALAVRKAALRYRSPARYGETLVVRTWIEKLGGASVLFQYEIVRKDSRERVAEGTTELACVDLRSPSRPVCMVPEDLREALRSALPPA